MWRSESWACVLLVVAMGAATGWSANDGQITYSGHYGGKRYVTSLSFDVIRKTGQWRSDQEMAPPVSIGEAIRVARSAALKTIGGQGDELSKVGQVELRRQEYLQPERWYYLVVFENL